MKYEAEDKREEKKHSYDFPAGTLFYARGGSALILTVKYKQKPANLNLSTMEIFHDNIEVFQVVGEAKLYSEKWMK